MFRNLLTAMISVLITGCISTEVPAPPSSGAAGASKFLQLSLSVASGSRGDAHTPLEPGINNENRVENICLFFYDDAQGINAAAETPIKYAQYFDDVAIDLMFGLPVRIKLELGQDNPFALGQHVAVLINMGDLCGKLTTLGEIRDHLEDSWRQGASIPEYKYFTMSTASDSDGVLGCTITDTSKYDETGYAPGEENNPFVVSATVERTAARIDFAFDNTNLASDGSLVYTVAGADGQDIARAYFIDMEVYNRHQQRPFAVKRTTPGLSLSTTARRYAAEEQVGADGRPANYVIEPNTLTKGASSDMAALFGDLRASNLSAGIFGAGMKRYTDHAFKLKDSWEMAAILAYANESTQAAGLPGVDFAPGIAIKARYVPVAVIGPDGTYSDYSLPEGSDLALYRVSAGSEAGSTLWFAGEDLARDYAAQHPADEAVITVYPGGICYYTLTLRHHLADDSNPAAPFAMEYAVVRNHVYRAGVRVTGPGNPDPDEDKPVGLNWRIFVRKWNFRQHTGIIM